MGRYYQLRKTKYGQTHLPSSWLEGHPTTGGSHGIMILVIRVRNVSILLLNLIFEREEMGLLKIKV